MKSTLTPFIIIIICIAAYYMYISPLYAEMQLTREEKNKYADVLDKAKNISQKREELLGQYNSISLEDIEKMKKVVPPTFDGPGLVNDLNYLASRYNTSIDSFNSNIPEENSSQAQLEDSNLSPFKKVRITFDISSTYPQFISFLKDLESNVQIIDVYSVSISAGSDDQNSSVLNFSVEANTYILR